jgi:mono/diheme cytochrome c family protein
MEPYARRSSSRLGQIAAYFAAPEALNPRLNPSAEAIAKGKQAAAQCAVCHGPPPRQGDAAPDP